MDNHFRKIESSKKKYNIILNFIDVEYINSLGVTKLVHIYRYREKRNFPRIIAINMDPKIYAQLERLEFEKAFTIL